MYGIIEMKFDLAILLRVVSRPDGPCVGLRGCYLKIFDVDYVPSTAWQKVLKEPTIRESHTRINCLVVLPRISYKD
jgi:hypothetical protein